MNPRQLVYQAGGRLGIGRIINKAVGPERAKKFSRVVLESRAMMDYDSILGLLRANHIEQVPGEVLEIGCWRGEGTRLLLKWAIKHDKAVYACDAFEYDPDPEGQRRRFHRATSPFPNLWFHDGDSLQLADHLPVVDFCFAIVDGCHDNPQVRSDIALAWDRLNPGGILLVDDVQGKYPDVVREVRAFEERESLVGRHGLSGYARWYRKP